MKKCKHIYKKVRLDQRKQIAYCKCPDCGKEWQSKFDLSK